MSDDWETDKSKEVEKSIEVGENERFLSRNHARYEDGDESDDEREKENDQNIDESMDKY